MTLRSLRVAVIGAGAAGLVAARELRREGHAPVVFERTDGVGGTWVYEDDADADAPASPDARRRSNLYASLRTNLPRECMGFLDFPIVAGPGPDGDARRFPGHAAVLRYLEDFARRFDLRGLVRLETEVVRVSREAGSGSGSRWRVRYSRKGETEESEVFDAVVVCNGHFSRPYFADVAGLDAWPGKQLHSTSYRVPDPFRGQGVDRAARTSPGTSLASPRRSISPVHRTSLALARICLDMPISGFIPRSRVPRKTGVWSSKTAVGSRRMSSCIAAGTPRSCSSVLWMFIISLLWRD